MQRSNQIRRVLQYEMDCSTSSTNGNKILALETHLKEERFYNNVKIREDWYVKSLLDDKYFFKACLVGWFLKRKEDFVPLVQWIASSSCILEVVVKKLDYVDEKISGVLGETSFGKNFLIFLSRLSSPYSLHRTALNFTLGNIIFCLSVIFWIIHFIFWAGIE